MSIREKIAARKTKSDSTPRAKRPWGSMITTLLLLALLAVGVMLLLKLNNLSDLLAAGSGDFNFSANNIEAPASYEYAIDFILDPNIAQSMTQRGRAGWQVVGSRRTQDTTTGQYGYEFIFMRKAKAGS